jgi:hypothetical protein
METDLSKKIDLAGCFLTPRKSGGITMFQMGIHSILRYVNHFSKKKLYRIDWNHVVRLDYMTNIHFYFFASHCLRNEHCTR